MKITPEMLEAQGACDLEKFKERWPEGCDVTPETCQIAFVQLGMFISWAAHAFLSEKASAEYDKASGRILAECSERGDTKHVRCWDERIEVFCELAQKESP